MSTSPSPGRPGRGGAFELEARFVTPAGITVVCGSSGAGKSTLLSCLLGALRPDRGAIRLGEKILFDGARGIDLPVRERSVGMVFQDAPLFPHLNVRGNVSFGCRRGSGVDSPERFLERVGALGLARRWPSELSGGQRQRVALARALAAEPAAMLLDEPFSALDAEARQSLGSLLVELQAATGIPFIHVTHDLGEAVRMGSHLVLLNEGRIVQTGVPGEVIARPDSVVAARAVGTENLFSGVVRRQLPEEGCTEIEIEGTTVVIALVDSEPGDSVAVGIRAEDILLSLNPIRETSARNVLAGTIERLAPRGAVVEARVDTPAAFRVIITPASVKQLGLREGRPVYLLIKAAAFTGLL